MSDEEVAAPATVHVLIMGVPLCVRRVVGRCDFPSQDAALDELVRDGTWQALPYEARIQFVKGKCGHGR